MVKIIRYKYSYKKHEYRRSVDSNGKAPYVTAEVELDQYLNEGWEIVSTSAYPEAAFGSSLDNYLVVVLKHTN